MTKPLNIEFEKAVRFLATHLPPSDENSRKPVLFHDIRVGIYLYENGYAPDVVLAGILHDTLEWSDADEQMLRENFGDNVTAMVSACTKNNSIADREERNIEMIKHCIQIGEDALIVKAADIIDSFKWYSSQDNHEQLQFQVAELVHYVFHH